MSSEIQHLLAAPPTAANARALYDWAIAVPGRIARGDMVIGILSVDDAANVPTALSRAASGGIDEAWFDLAAWLANPPFGEPDPSAGDALLVEALGRGVAGAGLRLAQLRWFHRREDCEPDQRAEAYRLAEEHVARHPADAPAIYLLGLLTFGGFGVPQDTPQALELQNRAADLGDPDAMFELYALLANGIGGTPDGERIFHALTRAADAGHPRALYNVGAFYATGRNVRKDMAMAAQWYQRAADAGHARAIATLAVMYANGDGVARDLERAEELFGQAEYFGLDVQSARSAAGL